MGLRATVVVVWRPKGRPSHPLKLLCFSCQRITHTVGGFDCGMVMAWRAWHNHAQLCVFWSTIHVSSKSQIQVPCLGFAPPLFLEF
eukprot:m.498177 g.498177  ORF g.498177 m.498177 type:complete len:86 (+) comp53350_c0_seq1:33-290(+)